MKVPLKQEEEVPNGFDLKFNKKISLQSTNSNDKTKFQAKGDLFNEEENNNADDSENNEVDQDYEFYNDLFDSEIDLNDEIDNNNKTSTTENYMEEMYEVSMKKAYQEYLETEDGIYNKDQIKGHLQNETAYLNGAKN